MKIILNPHHIPFLKCVRSTEQLGKTSVFMFKQLYGKKFTDKIFQWAKNLERDTLVIISGKETPDFPLRSSSKNGYIPDSLCEEGCPYLKGCNQEGSSAMYNKLMKRKPYIFPLFLIGQIISGTNDKKEMEKRNLELGKAYKLEDLLTKEKPKQCGDINDYITVNNPCNYHVNLVTEAGKLCEADVNYDITFGPGIGRTGLFMFDMFLEKTLKQLNVDSYARLKQIDIRSEDGTIVYRQGS